MLRSRRRYWESLIALHWTSITTWAKTFFPAESTAFIVMKFAPGLKLVSSMEALFTTQFAEVDTQDTIGCVPSGSDAVYGIEAVVSLEVRYSEPKVSDGVEFPSKSVSRASTLARYLVSTKKGT